MLDVVKASAEGESLQNVSTVLNTGETVPLPDRLADLVICGLVIHDQPEPSGRVDFVTEARRLLSPSGRVLVIEWVPQAGDDHRRRMTPDQLSAVLREAGMDLDGPEPLGRSQYMMVARR